MAEDREFDRQTLAASMASRQGRRDDGARANEPQLASASSSYGQLKDKVASLNALNRPTHSSNLLLSSSLSMGNIGGGNNAHGNATWGVTRTAREARKSTSIGRINRKQNSVNAVWDLRRPGSGNNTSNRNTNIKPDRQEQHQMNPFASARNSFWRTSGAVANDVEGSTRAVPSMNMNQRRSDSEATHSSSGSMTALQDGIGASGRKPRFSVSARPNGGHSGPSNSVSSEPPRRLGVQEDLEETGLSLDVPAIEDLAILIRQKGSTSMTDSVFSKDSQAQMDSTRQRSSASHHQKEIAAHENDQDWDYNEDNNSAAASYLSSHSDHSDSLLNGKPVSRKSIGSAAGSASTDTVLLGKSSSLIFPTGVEVLGDETREMCSVTRRRINLLLDKCDAIRFPFKKKLDLRNQNLVSSDVPVKDLCNSSLGNSLKELTLAGNRLSKVPELIIRSLPVLRHLDLSQCDLHNLPGKWNLPQLKVLNLSHNRLVEFPEASIQDGLRELQDLTLYGNKVSSVVISPNPKTLSKLETLDLGYNDLSHLPENMDHLKALRVLKLMNNFLEKVPMRVCEMELRIIDVSSNPVLQPPIETCERGIGSMKRYYSCLRLEEQSMQRGDSVIPQKSSSRPRKNGEKGTKTRKPRLFNMAKKSYPAASFQPYQRASSNATSAYSEDSLPDATPQKDASILNPMALPIDDVQAAATSEYQKLAQDEGRETSSDADLGKERHILSDSVDDFAGDVQPMPDTKILMPRGVDEVTVNDTLKVIFVGMALAGKTSIIKRLIEGKDAIIPKKDERTVGVDIYEWDPKDEARKERYDVDTRIEFEDKELGESCGDVNVKFSVWDFAGQHVYHATHELFFSPRALYVLVWDMGATNSMTQKNVNTRDDVRGAFKLSYDSSDEEDDDFVAEEKVARADRALDHDIDEKVQFWVDCIQSSVPGAAIMPVASFNDFFENGGSNEEALRRCTIMKERLLTNEERRIKGLKDRLKDLENNNRADDQAALRLRKLLDTYTRPKLIFGTGDEDDVVRVSGTKYTGFDRLTEKITNIATGRDRAGWQYPIFRGHVGARIPRMRLGVRHVVREMRDRFKVVEWGHFLHALKEGGNYSAEHVSDALHFLTNIGELSYFGNLSDDYDTRFSELKSMNVSTGPRIFGDDGEFINNSHNTGDRESLSVNASNTIEHGSALSSVATSADVGSSPGLSQFVFLNPRWLVAAVACILRHDLEREIRDTRRLMVSPSRARHLVEGGDTFVYDTNMNCPIITAEEACMLWQAKKFTKKAAERALLHSNNLPLTPFDFLQRLLIRFGVFVPIDLSIENISFGGKEYTRPAEEGVPRKLATPSFFFLPSLLGLGKPSEAWTYKNSDSWTTTVCNSILFPDGVPPGLMERVTAAVLSSIYAVARQDISDDKPAEGHKRVKEILCWRTAFLVKIGTVTKGTGTYKEGFTEIFAQLADRKSHLCVGSEIMKIGMRRLMISAKGQAGDNGRKIWDGGYSLVNKTLHRVMQQYGGLEYEAQSICPECLSKKSVSQASAWSIEVLKLAARNGDETVRCPHHGHRVSTRLVNGPSNVLSTPKAEQAPFQAFEASEPTVPISDILRGVVVVGLWDGEVGKVVRVGSGFIVDRKRGLIVTAGHTFMNIWGDKRYPFGENYYGLRDAKVVIGVIPRQKGTGSNVSTEEAVFRYFAKIVAKDENIESRGECRLDACVLRITTRMEHDVGGDGDDCGKQPERLLLNNPDALKREKLLQLKVTEKCELDEQVRILGYNQGGEGIVGRGERLNRYVDFARGYVCKKFATGEDPSLQQRNRFKPREEIVVICPTIGGHSGGPCVNEQGEVIGILSRGDPAENQRCYLVPSYEWKSLVRQAKCM